MGSETDTARWRLEPFCHGNGLDIGFGGSPIKPSAICIDRPEGAAGRRQDPSPAPTHLVGPADNLYWFKDNVLDYVYSSHVLEDFLDTEGVLREWLRVLKPGGNLVLFLPDQQVYVRETPKQHWNQDHKHAGFGLVWLKEILLKMGVPASAVIHEMFPVPGNAYSFDIVIKKP